jgi:hypothetical protein
MWEILLEDKVVVSGAIGLLLVAAVAIAAIRSWQR